MSMPEFEPSPEQRETVGNLAAAGHMTVAQIAKTVVNPRTGKPVGERTLRRVFHRELAQNTTLQTLIIKKFTEAVHGGEPWAIKLGMEYVVGVKNEETKTVTNVAVHNKGVALHGPASID